MLTGQQQEAFWRLRGAMELGGDGEYICLNHGSVSFMGCKPELVAMLPGAERREIEGRYWYTAVLGGDLEISSDHVSEEIKP